MYLVDSVEDHKPSKIFRGGGTSTVMLFVGYLSGTEQILRKGLVEGLVVESLSEGEDWRTS